MKVSIRALVVAVAAGTLVACGGGYDLRNVAPKSASAGMRGTVHHVQTISPPGHIPAGSREYTYQIVVVRGTDNVNHVFSAPQSVTAIPGGVRVVNGTGKVIDFADGTIVSHGTGAYYLRAGQRLPAGLSHATPGRIFPTTEYR